MSAAEEATLCRIVRAGRVWVCDDDLGVARIPLSALAQDARGALWLGSEDGPRCFDGRLWARPPGLAALAGCVVTGLTVDAATLWLAMRGAGLAAVDLDATPQRVRVHLTAATGLPSDVVRAAHATADGALWAATEAGLALVRDDRVQRVLTAADGLPSADIWALCPDAAGRLWVGTSAGLAVVAQGAVVARPRGPDLLPAGGVQALCCDERGRVWVGMLDGQVLRVDAVRGDRIALTPLYRGAPRVRALCPDGHGGLWVGTTTGVVALEGGRVRDTLAREDGLPGMGVWALARDAEGRLWAATSAGLALLQDTPGPVRALPAPAAVPAVSVFAYAPDGRGRLWVGTEAGVHLLDGDDGRPCPAPPLPPSVAAETVWALQRDGRGTLWVGTHRDGLYGLDPASGAVRAHLLVANDVPALCLDPAGRLWASFSGHGLVCLDPAGGAVLHQVGVAEGLPQARVLSLAVDQRGRLWAGTWAGWLVCLDPRTAVVRGAWALGAMGAVGDAAVQRPITDLACTADGRLWASSYGGGLLCVDPDRGAVVGRVTAAEGLPSDLLYSCQADARGQLWLGTRRGVARYTPATGACVVVGRALGLPHDECNARARYLDAAGRLWIGTVQGVGCLDTRRVPDRVPPAAVRVTGLRVVGVERPLVPALEIEDTDYDLLFSYGTATFTAPAQVHYRTQLVGLDPAWSAPTAQRSAHYTALRPGAYTFRVSARNWGGQWGPAAAVPFRVVRNRQAQEQDAAQERARIETAVLRATAERLATLNRQLEEADRLKTALIAQIQEQAAQFERLAQHDGLTGLLNRRALDALLVEACARAQATGHPLTVGQADIDHFKRINDTYGHQVGDAVLQAVAELCRTQLRVEDSVGRYGGEEITLVLPATALEQGVERCERVRAAVAGHDWGAIAPGLRVTLSLGVAAGGAVSTPADLLGAADQALYQAKRQGRNCTRPGSVTDSARTAIATVDGDRPARGAA